MSTLAANNITDAAGTGGPTLTNGLTIGTSPLAAPSGLAPSYTCRAWVNFNGTGTVAIRASGNVTSITDNNTGQYTVNFTTAMPDANYSAVASSDRAGGNANAAYTRVHSYATTSVQIATVDTGAFQDPTVVSVAIFR